MSEAYIPTSEFSTEWAKNWAQNYVEFSATNEVLVYSNVRSTVLDAQREFERHLEGVMHYRSHQREF